MKITKFITTVLIAIITVQAQAFSEKIKGNGKITTEQRTTGSYDRISIGGSFRVELVSGKEGNITIKAESNLTKYIITEVKNGTLKIHWKRNVNVSHKKPIHITIPFTEIDGVSLGGSGKVTSSTTIKVDEMQLSLSGSGNMNLTIDASSLKTQISGSGGIKLSGNSGSMDCSISGSGNFNSYELNVGDTTAKVSGSGNIKVTVNGKLNAKISGSGNIRYRGNPTTEIIKVSGSGHVTKN